MSLPRWTVYPALMVIAALIVVAIPKRTSFDPYESGPLAAAKPMVVLGVDGMDPDILKEVIARYPDRMTNFRWLIERADGIQELTTSTPPQSPVAWSNFITGMNPGGHGIFDFIHRDLVHRAPAASTTRTEKGWRLGLPGSYKIDIGADSPSNRTGEPFWAILRSHGVPADIWRVPANFPVEPSDGYSFSGMMTPALDSAYGECSFFTTSDLQKIELDYSKAKVVTEFEGIIDTSIDGPTNPFREGSSEETVEKLSFRAYVDRTNNAMIIYAGMPDDGVEKVVLRPGEWSGFLSMEFKLLPLGLIVAIALYRYTHRLSGARWIIRHGEVCIERMTWTGRPSAETIKADDVAAVEVDKPDTKGRTCTISIRLRSGHTFRSPTRHDESGARALRVEIVRRLNIFPDSGSAG